MSFAGAKELQSAGENNDPRPDYTALFNGSDLDGWRGMNISPYELAEMSDAQRDEFWETNQKDVLAHWSVQDGELVNDGHGVYLTTVGEYQDIEFWIDYKMVPVADSGIYLRATPQVQIWDFTGDEAQRRRGSGGLWNNSPGSAGKDPLVLADRPLGDWNRFRIRQLGSRTWVWLNGKMVVDGAIMENYWERSKPLLPRGPIQLQTHGGEIRWRNIFLREIEAEEANQLLSVDNEGFEPIFNGKDLEGWIRSDGYEVVDGVLRCRKAAHSVMYWHEDLADFVIRLEFKLPPVGNNGLAIRYPGNGKAERVGMCELQVLDNTAEEYADLDPRQYHGSIYGMVPAHRGYLRPVGQWNYQEVKVQGSTIRAELNGNVIVDGDVSKVTEFMDDPPPGRNRTSGFFGFAGHDDMVEFRRIRLKRLSK